MEEHLEEEEEFGQKYGRKMINWLKKLTKENKRLKGKTETEKKRRITTSE